MITRISKRAKTHFLINFVINDFSFLTNYISYEQKRYVATILPVWKFN